MIDPDNEHLHITSPCENRDFSRLDLRNESAENMEFVNCTFDRADLKGSNFAGAKFYGCSFQKVRWDNADLSGAKFFSHGKEEIALPATYRDAQKSGSMRVASFRGSDLSMAEFTGTSDHLIEINDSDFSGADLTGSLFKYCDLSHCFFLQVLFHAPNGYQVSHGSEKRKNTKSIGIFGEGCKLDFSDFSYTNLTNLRFQECESLEATNFSNSDLEGAIFLGRLDVPINMYRARFNNSRLKNSTFENCKMDSISFLGADMAGTVFKGEKTTALAADFSNSNMAGFIGNDCNFTAAIFSCAYLSGDQEMNLEAAKFKKSELVATDFSSADLKNVDFEGANLYQADFTHATFVENDDKESHERQSYNVDNTIFTIHVEHQRLLKDVDFQKADFTGASLQGCTFVDCICSDTIFKDAILRYCRFQGTKTNLTRCDFSGSDLHCAVFDGVSGRDAFRLPLVRSSFENSNLSLAVFVNCDIDISNFCLSNLSGAKFYNCCLDACKFEHSNFDKIKIIGCSFSYTSFIRTRGTDVVFEDKIAAYKSEDYYDANQSPFFSQCKFRGRFIKKFKAAILEHSGFILINSSEIEFDYGTRINGSLLKLEDGKMAISRSRIDNSMIINNSNQGKSLLCRQGSSFGTEFKDPNSNCEFEGMSFDSCNMLGAWYSPTFKECKFKFTDMKKDPNNPDGQIIDDEMRTKIKANYDELSLAGLQNNAVSLGNDNDQDTYYALRQEKKQEEEIKKNGHPLPTIWGKLLLGLFFLYPLFFYGSQKENSIVFEFFLPFLILLITIHIFYKSKIEFLKKLYGYGKKTEIIVLNIFLVIAGFSVSWFLAICSVTKKIDSDFINLYTFLKYLFKNFLSGIHLSINTFVTIGYWRPDGTDYLPNGLMLFYSNVEALTGAIMLALLVVTLIRNSSPR